MLASLRTSLPDHELLSSLTDIVSRDRATTAEMLELIGEVERRRLYAAAGFESMHRYCVGKLKMSGDMAYKRVRAARVSRRQSCNRCPLPTSWTVWPRGQSRTIP